MIVNSTINSDQAVQPGRSPDRQERLDGDVEPRGDDRKCVKEGNRRRGDDRRHQPLSYRRTREPEPNNCEYRQSQVGEPVEPDPRLGIGFVKQQEVAEPSQTELGITARVVIEVIDGPVEEDSRSLWLC